MASQNIPVKVYYVENGVNKEIRKFTLDQDVATNYSYIMGRIKVYFTSLLRKDLKLYFKDDEDDYISISCDSELFEVMKKATTRDDTQPLKLYIEVNNSTSIPVNNQHPGIVCDGCNSSINGIRYKCTICQDFDLCSTCEGNQTHPIDHNLLCIKKPCSTMESFMCAQRTRMGRPSRMFCRQFNRPQHFTQFSLGRESKPDKPCATHLREFIQELAPSLGFDPDVAISQMQTLLDHFQSQPKSGCSFQNKNEANLYEQCTPEGLKDFLKPLFEEPMEGVSKQEESDEKKDEVFSGEGSSKESENANENVASEPNKPRTTHLNEFIQELAPSLGFDPDVAISQMQTLLDHFQSQPKSGCSFQNKNEANLYEQCTPEGLKDFLKPLFGHFCAKEEPMEEGVSKQKESEEKKDEVSSGEGSSKQGENDNEVIIPESTSENITTPDVDKSTLTSPPIHPTIKHTEGDFLAAATPLFNQMGMRGEISEDQLQALGKIMQTAMQSIGSEHSLSSASDEHTEHNGKETPSNDYVFVDEKDRSEITEEEMFERRLNDALNQMEAMGFDNDGDWLKQLLVAKNLDISRVLDALNACKE